jgi:hypothetical protein
MPTVDIPDKICPHCGGTRWFLYYRKYKDTVYTKYTCSLRQKQNIENWKKANPQAYKASMKKSKEKNKHKHREKEKIRAKAYYAKNRDKVINRSKQWKENNLEVYKKHRKKIDKEASLILSDRYIKSLICDDRSIEYGEITPELIELKRKQLLLKRKIKQHAKS